MAAMTAPFTEKKRVQGGSFLIHDAVPGECFFPEDFSEEQRQIARTAAEFAVNEILPATTNA